MHITIDNVMVLRRGNDFSVHGDFGWGVQNYCALV